jgi:hypothetical protein
MLWSSCGNYIVKWAGCLLAILRNVIIYIIVYVCLTKYWSADWLTDRPTDQPTNRSTNQRRSWSRTIREKLTDPHLVKKLPAFYGTWRSITIFTRACNLSLSWARSIQSMFLHPTSYRFILILYSHLCLCLPSGLFPSGSPPKQKTRDSVIIDTVTIYRIHPTVK